jgi:lipoprotein-releasing system permease protein
LNVPTLIGFRYSRSRTNDRFASFISTVSFLGLVLGVVALTVVVSVMNGFDRELKRRILGVVPHVVVTDAARVSDAGGDVAGKGATSWIAKIPVNESIVAQSPFLEDRGLVVSPRGNRLIALYGILPELESTMSILPEQVVSGSLRNLEQGSRRIILGEPIARQLGLVTGDQLSLIVPKLSSEGRVLKPNLVRVELGGTFQIGSEIDYGLGVMHLADLESLSQAAVGVRLRLDDIFAAPGIAAELGANPEVTVADWTEVHGDFFETVRMEKIMMFVLLSFVIAIASFSIVSGLTMMVNSKRRDIAVLRTMGLPGSGVMMVFIVQGMGVATLGITVGILLGVPLAFYAPELMATVEQVVGVSIIEGTYFNRIPTDVRPFDVVVIAIVALTISFTATLYPSYRASQLNPASILRYE